MALLVAFKRVIIFIFRHFAAQRWHSVGAYLALKIVCGWDGLDLIGFNFPSKVSSEESLMLSPASGKIKEERNDRCMDG